MGEDVNYNSCIKISEARDLTFEVYNTVLALNKGHNYSSPASSGTYLYDFSIDKNGVLSIKKKGEEKLIFSKNRKSDKYKCLFGIIRDSALKARGVGKNTICSLFKEVSDFYIPCGITRADISDSSCIVMRENAYKFFDNRLPRKAIIGLMNEKLFDFVIDITSYLFCENWDGEKYYYSLEGKITKFK